MNEDIIIRDATREDAPLIAWTLNEASGLAHDEDEQVRLSAETEESLYSWRFTRVAEIGGKAAGCQIAYTGSDYMRLRKHTFQSIWPYLTDSHIENAALEADLDEFHLESMAVLPEYRGRGISRVLIMDSVRKGQALGYEHIAFLVNLEKAGLLDYYRKLGFVPEKELRLFLTDYVKMRYVEQDSVHNGL